MFTSTPTFSMRRWNKTYSSLFQEAEVPGQDVQVAETTYTAIILLVIWW